MIVLDTAAWIWWVTDPARLSARARGVLEVEEGRQGLVVSAISVWEVAVKVGLGKLAIDRDVRSWVRAAWPRFSANATSPSTAPCAGSTPPLTLRWRTSKSSWPAR